jgi:hypothetical protein
MTTYIVSTGTEQHTVDALTFTLGADLRFIGQGGSIVALFTSFVWFKVVEPVVVPVEPEAPSTATPELAGE